MITHCFVITFERENEITRYNVMIDSKNELIITLWIYTATQNENSRENDYIFLKTNRMDLRYFSTGTYAGFVCQMESVRFSALEKTYK